MDRAAQPPIVACMRLINGYQVSRALHVGVVLGVFDRLAKGPRASAELAAEIDAHAGALHRLLRTLAGFELLHEEDDGRFSLTPIGSCLRSDSPSSVAP